MIIWVTITAVLSLGVLRLIVKNHWFLAGFSALLLSGLFMVTAIGVSLSTASPCFGSNTADCFKKDLITTMEIQGFNIAAFIFCFGGILLLLYGVAHWSWSNSLKSL